MAPGASSRLRIEPHAPGVDRRLWWGAGSRETAEWTARQGLNLMSSTLLTEATGEGFSHLQAEQIRRYREAWKEAGHDWTPRVSVSRSIFPIVSETDRRFFVLRGEDSHDQIGVIDGLQSTFGRTYAAEPDVLIEQLTQDEALHAADTVMLTIPSQLGVDFNLHILQAFAAHAAPRLALRCAVHQIETRQREGRERIHQEPGHKRGRQEEQQRRVNTGRVLQRPKVAGRVARLVHLDDGYLHQLHLGARGAQQHGELVLVLITRNL